MIRQFKARGGASGALNEQANGLVFRDGFADDQGQPNPDLPVTTAHVTIADIGGGRTRMSIQSVFPSAEALEQLLGFGMEEGLTEAVGQIDAILAEGVPA